MHKGIMQQDSLQQAIAVRFSDVKVVSVGTIPEIQMPEKE